MIRQFFKKAKGDSTLDKNTEDQDAEIVDIAGEEANDISAELNEQSDFKAQAAVIQADMMNKLMRLQADFDNYRKRTATGRMEAREEARRELILDLLPIYDNFLRAMGHAEEVEDYGSLRAGIQGILQQMRDFFQRQNLKEISCDPGTVFDPNLHDAVGTMPGDADNNNTIGQEVLKGFELNGYVIRPATVLVYSE